MHFNNVCGKPGVVAYACNLSTWRANTQGSWLQGQFGLYGMTLTSKIKCFVAFDEVVPHLGVNPN